MYILLIPTEKRKRNKDDKQPPPIQAIERVHPIALQPSIPQTTATGHSIRPLGRILERTTVQIDQQEDLFQFEG
jgi:hypothetical protein